MNFLKTYGWNIEVMDVMENVNISYRGARRIMANNQLRSQVKKLCVHIAMPRTGPAI